MVTLVKYLEGQVEVSQAGQSLDEEFDMIGIKRYYEELVRFEASRAR